MPDVLDKFQPLFDPKSVAFVGASNATGKWGYIVLRNLITGGYEGNPVDMVAGNVEGALMKSLEILFKAPETDCIILLGILGFMKIRPIDPASSSEKIEEHIINTLNQLSDAVDTVKEMSHHYQKPVAAATEIPFAVGDMEERIFYRLGSKGFPLFKTPDAAARVMSCLVGYSNYLNTHRKENL